jgi:uncharacterized protein (TIGR02453 family)
MQPGSIIRTANKFTMTKSAHFTTELFAFLRALKRHNNREWFQANKSRYEQYVRDPFLKFIEDFRPRLHSISPHFIADPRPSGGSLLRIYRDMRFRPDQAPYQTMAAARFPHVAWKQRHAPGHYLHLEPGKSFLGMGLWHPDTDTRALVRETIVRNDGLWRRATTAKSFEKKCRLGGDSMKRLPSGYDPNHPFAVDLMRKDFICWSEFSDAEVCSATFLNDVISTCRVAAPFMEFLTRAVGLPWAATERVPVREVMSAESENF